MTQLLKLLDTALLDPLGEARRRAAAGQRVIATAGVDIPFELIIAAGAFPLLLPSLPTPTPSADEYLEATFSPTARSIAEQWLTGQFDFIDSVVFPRSNDSLQRTYYYLCELQRCGSANGPRPLLYDIAKIPRATSLQYSLSSTVRLAGELDAAMTALPAAIRTRNRRRRLMNELLRRRRAVASSSDGAMAERIARGADCCEAEAFDAAFEGWLETEPVASAGPRLLLIGSAPPDDRLHLAVRAAGGRVVDELGDHATDRLGGEIYPGSAPLESIAAHYAQIATGPRSFKSRASRLGERLQEAQIDGAILWIIEEDESIVWDVPPIVRTLRQAGIPLLELTRRNWNETDTAAIPIGHFVSHLEHTP